MPLDVSLSAGLPSAMVGRGILALHSAYVLMWRPWCMAHLSSHARAAGAPTSVTWQRHELVELEGHVVIHRELTRRGKRVLVLSYADLLWDGSRTLRRLEAFLPCAGKLSRSFLPRQGVDVFGNDWKVKKNVQTYSVEHSSEDSGFDVRLGRCTDLNLYDPLMPMERARAEAAVAYLQMHGRLDDVVSLEAARPPPQMPPAALPPLLPLASNPQTLIPALYPLSPPSAPLQMAWPPPETTLPPRPVRHSLPSGLLIGGSAVLATLVALFCRWRRRRARRFVHSQLSTSEDVNEYGLRWFVDEPVAIETGIPVGGAAKPGVPEEVAAQEEEEPEEPEKQEG